jgi:hypothetical protein
LAWVGMDESPEIPVSPAVLPEKRPDTVRKSPPVATAPSRRRRNTPLRQSSAGVKR